MKLAYLGNFMPGHPEPYSTETHVARSMELLGHEVVRIQEGDTPAMEVPDHVAGCDLLVHTQTTGLAITSGTLEHRLEASRRIMAMGIPRVYFHLDLYWHLPRHDQLAWEPWTQYEHVFTADGSAPELWEQAGINHHWLPPGVFGPECYAADVPITREIVFVGSWRGGYHPESKHRFELVKWLKRTYRNRVTFFPRPGQPAVRGDALNRVYAGAKIAIGDSCMVPELKMYISDRCPESMGRGSFFMHPHVDGIFPELWESGKHLVTWEAGDWNGLRKLIDHYLEADDEREEIRRLGHEHTKANHTYQHRVQTVLETVGLA